MADAHKGEDEGTAAANALPAALPEAKVISGGPPAPQLDLHAKPTYPDDGPLARQLRVIDGWVGAVEQALLVFVLASVVIVTATHALSERLAHYRLWFKNDVVHAGTFAMAMLGAAFASHQMKHLSMDLLSRRLSPRNRLVLKLVLAAFVVFVLCLLVRSGIRNVVNEGTMPSTERHLPGLAPKRIALLIPIGAVLMIFHQVLHAVIDIDYLARRKTPPERMRSGH